MAGVGCLLTYAKRVESARNGRPWSWFFPQSRLISAPARRTTKARHDSGDEFGEALNDLTDLFKSHPDASKKELISKLNAGIPMGAERPCPLDWRDEALQLSVAQDNEGRMALAKAVKSCSQAIESLPD